MKKKSPRARRELFVFTADEKKGIACVLAAVMIGLATKHYRETHPRPPAPPTAREAIAARRIAKAKVARARSARGNVTAVATPPMPTPPPLDEDDE